MKIKIGELEDENLIEIEEDNPDELFKVSDDNDDDFLEVMLEEGVKAKKKKVKVHVMELYNRVQDVVQSVNKSIDDTIDEIDTRFIQNSIENLEAISKVVDIKRSLDLETIEHLAAKYPSFITINKFENES